MQSSALDLPLRFNSSIFKMKGKWVLTQLPINYDIRYLPFSNITLFGNINLAPDFGYIYIFLRVKQYFSLVPWIKWNETPHLMASTSLCSQHLYALFLHYALTFRLHLTVHYFCIYQYNLFLYFKWAHTRSHFNINWYSINADFYPLLPSQFIHWIDFKFFCRQNHHNQIGSHTQPHRHFAVITTA